MTKQAFLLGIVFIGFNFASEAAERISFPEVTIDGSLPFQYSDNITRSARNRESDFYSSPYFRLSASGDLRDDFRYSLYASSGLDKYSKFTSNDGSLAAVGLQVTKKWESLQLGAGYERGYYYDGIFDGLFSAANDFGVFLRYSYVNAAGDMKIRPSMSVTTRANDNLTVQRDLVLFKVDFEHSLFDRWWIFLTPRLRIYDFVNRPVGRIDAIWAISTGLRYEIAKDVNLTSSIGYESRTSGVAGRNYNNMIVGVSLDFSYVIFGPN